MATWKNFSNGEMSLTASFTLLDIPSAQLGTTYTNIVTIAGTTGSVPFSITKTSNGAISSIDCSLDGGTTWIGMSGSMLGTQTLTIRIVTSTQLAVSDSYIVTIGSAENQAQQTMVVTNRSPDLTGTVTFNNSTNILPNVATTSTTTTISGLEPNYSIILTSTGGTIDAGTSVLSGTFATSKTVTTSGTGTLVIAARITASSSFATAVTCNITITNGTLTGGTYTVTTVVEDTTPDAFSLTAVNSAALNSVQTSNAITISGINSISAISISAGGSYSINGGAYTSAAGTVVNGNTITVRLTSSSSFSTLISTTLTIGGVQSTYNVTTLAQDTVPDSFSFTAVNSVDLSSVQTSNSITVAGINTSSPISIVGGTYSINGGAYTSAAGTVVNGNTVTVRVTASASFSTLVSGVLTIGTIQGTYNVTTLAIDTTPNAFSFSPASQTGVALNTQYSASTTITGINTSVSVSVTGGTASVSTINNNGTITVYLYSSGSYNTTTTVTLTIGGVSNSFSVTTLLPDTTPDQFYLSPSTHTLASINTQYSASTTITGINTSVSVSVTGGTASLSTVSNGSTITVYLYSSGSYGATTTATLTIGGVSSSFSVTTMDNIPDQFYLSPASVSSATPSQQYTASTTIYGINTSVPVSVTGGSASVSTVSNGGSITVYLNASSSYSSTTTATLNVGGVTNSFSVTTLAADTTPDSYSFTSLSNQNSSTVVTSNTVTITGINVGTSVSISGGTFSINGGAFTTSGTIYNNNTLAIRLTTSASWSTSVTATVTVGTLSRTFTATTMAQPSGTQYYTTVGSNTWTCPVGVTSVSICLIGGGGGGGTVLGSGGGGGGGCTKANNVAVTPGTNYTIVVGAAGTSTSSGGSSTGLGYTATGGSVGIVTVGGNGGTGTYSGGKGGSGASSGSYSSGGGGGGAAGWKGGGGAGGHGGKSTAAATTGSAGASSAGGGGGGGAYTTTVNIQYWGGGGGGGSYSNTVSGSGGIAGSGSVYPASCGGGGTSGGGSLSSVWGGGGKGLGGSSSGAGTTQTDGYAGVAYIAWGSGVTF